MLYLLYKFSRGRTRPDCGVFTAPIWRHLHLILIVRKATCWSQFNHHGTYPFESLYGKNADVSFAETAALEIFMSTLRSSEVH